jgi:hypothetical protein
MSAAPKVRVEKEESSPLAVVIGNGILAAALAKALKVQNLHVTQLTDPLAALPVLLSPLYIFFFAQPGVPLPLLRTQFAESLQSAVRSQSRVILILEGCPETSRKALWEEKDRSGWPVNVVEIRGEAYEDEAFLKPAVEKIVRLTSGGIEAMPQIILGKEKQETRKIESSFEVINRLDRLSHRRAEATPGKKFWMGILILILMVGLSPILFLGGSAVVALNNLQAATQELSAGQFVPARQKAEAARQSFAAAKTVTRTFGAWPVISVLAPTDKYFDCLVLGETAADVVYRLGTMGPKAAAFGRGLTSGEGTSVALLASDIQLEIDPLREDLGLLETQLTELVSGQSGKSLAMVGFPVEKIKKYLAEIPRARLMLTNINGALSVLPEIIPVEGHRTYLVVFQNSAELRPTGGFIGSYALVNFDQGKLTNYQIYDIYSADGQLRGQIAPPDEILHFLGQPSWYMRDANWSPDFPLTAERLQWFLEKETGQKADGVIAVNLGAVQKFLLASGSLSLPDQNQTVSAGDFFQKAEFAAEINFFAGSTQKKDFLGAVAKALLEKMASDADKNWLAFGQALDQSLAQKDILLYFNSPAAQQIVADNGWAGALETDTCRRKNSNCLMLVEANLGANKANYFVKRNVTVSSLIGKAGEVETTVAVHYRNDSPSNSWPGGPYKNYLRILVPGGSKFVDFDLGNGKKPRVSPILTAAEMANTKTDQFLVFQNRENIFDSFGTLVTIPIQSEQVVVFRYRPPVTLPFDRPEVKYSFHFLKQPGVGSSPFDFSLDYPSFLTPDVPFTSAVSLPLAFPQKLIYNSDLLGDQDFEVKFTK